MKKLTKVSERIAKAVDVLNEYPMIVKKLERYLNMPENSRGCPFSKIQGEPAEDRTCAKYCEKVFPEIKYRELGPICPCTYVSDEYWDGKKKLLPFIKKVLDAYYTQDEKNEDENVVYLEFIPELTDLKRKDILIDLMTQHKMLRSTLNKFLTHADIQCPFSKLDEFGVGPVRKTCKKYCYKVYPECELDKKCPCVLFGEDSVLSMIDECLDDFDEEYIEYDDCEASYYIKPEGGKNLKKDANDGRFGLDDSKVATKLLDKNFSPMIIRKYTRIGFPLYIHMICDANLDDLDTIVHDCIDFCKRKGILQNSIQSLRNFTGILSEHINAYYDKKKRGCVESLGIIFYCDKMIISSLQGDCMNHESCRQELYDCLNLMTKI